MNKEENRNGKEERLKAAKQPLGLTLERLVDAFAETDFQTRRDQILDEMYQLLLENRKLSEQGRAEPDERYNILDQIIDAFLEEAWFKDKLGYIAIMYDMVLTEDTLKEFYGRNAQNRICSYLVTKLSEEEKARIWESKEKEDF